MSIVVEYGNTSTEVVASGELVSCFMVMCNEWGAVPIVGRVVYNMGLFFICFRL